MNLTRIRAGAFALARRFWPPARKPPVLTREQANLDAAFAAAFERRRPAMLAKLAEEGPLTSGEPATTYGFRISCFALALILLPSLAFGQATPVFQSGQMIAAHDIAKVTRNGQIQDAGGLTGDALGRGVNPFSILDSKALGLCSNSAASTGAYNAFCLGHDSSGNPVLTIGAAGGAALGTPQINLGGTLYNLIGTGSANMVGPNSSVVNDVALFNNTTGTATKGTAGEFAYTTGAGFSMGYGPSPPGSQPGKLTVQNTHTGTAQTAFGIFGHLDFKPASGASTNPNGMYGDLWYDSATTFDGLGAALRGNSYTIPQITAAIQSAGSGYTNGDVVNAVGGTCTTLLNTAPQFTLTVSGGVVTAATYVAGGACTTYPVNPISVSGGTGSGLTLNLSHGNVNVTYLAGVYGRGRHTSRGTVTNTVALFADGAYNTGGGTTTNAIGMWVEPPYDSNFTNSYGIYLHGSFPGGALASLAGSDIIINPGAGANLTKVTGSLFAGTLQGACSASLQGGSNAQLQSAGAGCFLFIEAATGGQVNLGVNGLTSMTVNSPASTVNYLAINGGATGNAPSVTATGTDTNVDLSLGGQGTGQLKLNNAGSFAANGGVATVLGSIGPAGSHTTVQKWFTVKDSGGNLLYIPAF